MLRWHVAAQGEYDSARGGGGGGEEWDAGQRSEEAEALPVGKQAVAAISSGGAAATLPARHRRKQQRSSEPPHAVTHNRIQTVTEDAQLRKGRRGDSKAGSSRDSDWQCGGGVCDNARLSEMLLLLERMWAARAADSSVDVILCNSSSGRGMGTAAGSAWCMLLAWLSVI